MNRPAMNRLPLTSVTRACRLLRLGWTVCALGAALPAWALTPGIELPPDPGAPRPLVVPAFEEATLANGVRVVVAPRHELPLVTVSLHLRLGAAAEPEGRAGLASLTASLRTKGARVAGRVLGATQVAAQAEALGSSLEASSDWRGSALSMTVASVQLAPAAELLVGSTLTPTLAADELQRLKDQAADGLKLSLSDPMALASLAARRAFWGASVFGASTTPASLGRITRADVQAFHQHQLRPELATLMVAGDVSLPQAVALAQRLLGDWRPAAQPATAARQEPASPTTPATVLVNLPGAGQSGVVVMAPGVPDASPERRVAQVASAILGGGYSARLNAEVRVKRGLSYGAQSGLDFQPSGGSFSAQAQTNNATADQVVSLMKAEILKLGQPGEAALATPEELSARQATLVGNFGRQIETTGGLTGMALDLIGRQRPLAESQRFAPEVQAVTAIQVRDFAARHWTPASLRTLVVGDLAAAGSALKALDPQARVIDAAKLDLEAPGLQAQP